MLSSMRSAITSRDQFKPIRLRVILRDKTTSVKLYLIDFRGMCSPVAAEQPAPDIQHRSEAGRESKSDPAAIRTATEVADGT